MRQNVLYLGDAAIELGLLVFGFIVFTVFGRVAEGARFLDLLGNFFFLCGVEVIQISLKLFQTF